jgi:exopolysaccharide production protein ExoQ
MSIRSVFILPYACFLAVLARVTWSPIDSEQASFLGLTTDYSLLNSKPIVLSLAAILLPFIWYAGNPVRRLGIFPCVLITLAVTSVVWTYNIGQTLFSLTLMLTIVGYALVAARLLGRRLALLVVWHVATLIIIVSVVLAATGDVHAIMGGNHAGLWRGLFAHKNSFGPFLGAHLLISILGRRILGVPIFTIWMVAAIDLVAIVSAGSSTALLSLATGLAVAAVLAPFTVRGLRNLWRAIIGAVACGMVAFMIIDPDTALSLLGRDATLSNRTVMWSQVYPLSLGHKLGTGYGTGGGAQVSFEVQKAVHRKDTQGVQSGYLNLALELGWVTVILFLSWGIITFVGLFRSLGIGEGQALVGALMAQHLVISFSESFGCVMPSWSLYILLLVVVLWRDLQLASVNAAAP